MYFILRTHDNKYYLAKKTAEVNTVSLSEKGKHAYGIAYAVDIDKGTVETVDVVIDLVTYNVFEKFAFGNSTSLREVGVVADNDIDDKFAKFGIDLDDIDSVPVYHDTVLLLEDGKYHPLKSIFAKQPDLIVLAKGVLYNARSLLSRVAGIAAKEKKVRDTDEILTERLDKASDLVTALKRKTAIMSKRFPQESFYKEVIVELNKISAALK